MTTTATLPASLVTLLGLSASWHPSKPDSITVSGSSATLTFSGLAEMAWAPILPALGALQGAAPTVNYLTDATGAVLTDSAGNPLWV